MYSCSSRLICNCLATRSHWQTTPRIFSIVVCAAASVLSINTINSIEEFTDDAFECNSDEESGYLMFRLTEELSNESKILMKSLVRGVKDIQKDNEKYIKIVFKEV